MTRRRDAVIARVRDVTVILGTVAAMVALALSAVHAGDVQISRRDAAHDSCRLLVGLVSAATIKAPKQRKAAEAYMDRTPLRNCRLYAIKLVP